MGRLTVSSARVHGNVARAAGGGILGTSGAIFLGNGTSLVGNAAATGLNLIPQGAIVCASLGLQRSASD